jgi:geranylgeranyl diphosphate synthase, type I
MPIPTQTLDRLLTQYNADIEAAIAQHLNTPSAAFMRDMGAYAFGWVDEQLRPISGRKGKGVRPLLALLSYAALRGDYRAALPLAAAVELLHNYSLVHDDIEDRDEERRGRPTLWRVWGEALAINAGSGLYTLSFAALEALEATPAQKYQLTRLLQDTGLRLCEGQHFDLSNERVPITDVSEAQYLHMIAAKTSALLAYALQGGALLAEAAPDVADAYRECGELSGVAFQIRDDYLDTWGDAALRGKAQYGDIYRKKKTSPTLYALAHLPPAERAQLAALYADDDQPMSEAQVKQAVALLEQADAATYTLALADAYSARALAALDRTGVNSAAQSDLRLLIEYLTTRTY